MKYADKPMYLQLSLYEDVTEEDIRKTTYILKNHKRSSELRDSFKSLVSPMSVPSVKHDFFDWLTAEIKKFILNIVDPHEKQIAMMLFQEGKKYSAVRDYLSTGYKKELYPIQGSAFAEKRRNVIKNLAEHLKMLGVLDKAKYDTKGKLIFDIEINAVTESR